MCFLEITLKELTNIVVVFFYFRLPNKNLSQVIKSVSCTYSAMKYHSMQVLHLISFASFKETRIPQEMLFNSCYLIHEKVNSVIS